MAGGGGGGGVQMSLSEISSGRGGGGPNVHFEKKHLGRGQTSAPKLSSGCKCPDCIFNWGGWGEEGEANVY